ncbi:MAG TPA: TIGR02587 family membrane protein [Steroidobacteraceae bacterium]|nr:TIGR02587 family membrane protein [Steroidobacteraceae bacterium]
MTTRSYSWDNERDYAVSLARAFGGALLFSLPMLMTMEMWEIGVYMDRPRLALLLVLMIPLLIGLAYYLGFEATTNLRDAVLDAFVAITVAAILAAIVLSIFGELATDMVPREWIGKISLQSVAGSIGALLAQSQFGKPGGNRESRRQGGDFAEYFFMAAGALFLSTNVAPTEEVILIAHKMSPWHALMLILLSLLLMHAFVYAVNFRGQHARAEHISPVSEFVRFTVLGYCLAIFISAFMCWCFGRFDGVTPGEMLRISIVLGFPAAIGAAAARLVL